MRRASERKESGEKGAAARGKARGLPRRRVAGKPRACQVIRAVEVLSPSRDWDAFPRRPRVSLSDPYSFCMKSPRQIHAGHAKMKKQKRREQERERERARRS